MKTSYPETYDERRLEETKGMHAMSVARAIVKALDAGEGGYAYRVWAAKEGEKTLDDVGTEAPLKVRVAPASGRGKAIATIDVISPDNTHEMALETSEVDLDLIAPIMSPIAFCDTMSAWVSEGIANGNDDLIDKALRGAARWMTMPFPGHAGAEQLLFPAVTEAAPDAARRLEYALAVRDRVIERENYLHRYLQGHDPSGRQEQGRVLASDGNDPSTSESFADLIHNEDTQGAAIIADMASPVARARLELGTGPEHDAVFAVDENEPGEHKLRVELATGSETRSDATLTVDDAAPLINSNHLYHALSARLAALTQTAGGQSGPTAEELLRHLTDWMPMPRTSDENGKVITMAAAPLRIHLFKAHPEAACRYETTRRLASRLARRELYHGRYMSCARPPSSLVKPPETAAAAA